MNEEKFEVVVHHMGAFAEPNHLGYRGLESTWICHPDGWSYFEVLRGLKDMGYINLESLWYYDPQNINELIRLNNDVGTKRMMYISYNDGCVHLYVLYTVSEPVVEEYPTLEYFIEAPDPMRSNKVKCSGITMKGGPNNEVNEGGPSNVVDNESGPNIEVDKESGPSDVGGGSFNEVPVESGPINDTVFETEGVVDKESENVDQAFNRDESKNVSATEGAEEDSEDDSAFEVTFGDPDEEGVGFDDYFGEAPGQPQPWPNNEPFVPQSEPEPSQCVQAEPELEPQPSHHREDNPHIEPTVPYQTQPTADNSQNVPSVQTDNNPNQTQTDINPHAANPTETQIDTNSQPDNPTQTQNDTNSQPAQPKKKRGRPKKKPVTQTERVEEPLPETVIVTPLFPKLLK